MILTLPLIFFGVHGIYPHPIYDCDCAFAILAAIFFLQHIQPPAGEQESPFRQWLRPSIAGAAAVLPVFFKQNMGLPFLLAVVGGTLFMLLQTATRKPVDPRSAIQPSTMLRFLVAAAASSIAGILLLQFTVGLGNYLQWTVHFAAQRRLPGFADMISVYQQPSFWWTTPTLGCGLIILHTRLARHLWIRILALSLACAPFVATLIFLFLSDDLDDRADDLLALWPLLLVAAAISALFALRKGITLSRLLPFFVLAAIHGTFLSQQLWGSTYAIWPLLILLIATLLAEIPPASSKIALVLASVISATFLVCGSLYALGHERLNYIQLPDAPPHRDSLPALRGMATPGPYLADFEELVDFANNEIPPQDGILLLPGEEPFFYATGRIPRFPVQIFDQTTDPYSAAELMQEARKRNIKWVIVKTRLQSNADPLPDRELTMNLIQQEFRQHKRLDGYDVYRRR